MKTIGTLKPILVTGATGNVGLGVVQGLLDFTDPRTYGPALAGLEQVFLMRPPQIAQARYFRVTDTVQKLLVQPPIPLRQFVQDYRQVWT